MPKAQTPAEIEVEWEAHENDPEWRAALDIILEHVKYPQQHERPELSHGLRLLVRACSVLESEKVSASTALARGLVRQRLTDVLNDTALPASVSVQAARRLLGGGKDAIEIATQPERFTKAHARYCTIHDELVRLVETSGDWVSVYRESLEGTVYGFVYSDPEPLKLLRRFALSPSLKKLFVTAQIRKEALAPKEAARLPTQTPDLLKDADVQTLFDQDRRVTALADQKARELLVAEAGVRAVFDDMLSDAAFQKLAILWRKAAIVEGLSATGVAVAIVAGAHEKSVNTVRSQVNRWQNANGKPDDRYRDWLSEGLLAHPVWVRMFGVNGDTDHLTAWFSRRRAPITDLRERRAEALSRLRG